VSADGLELYFDDGWPPLAPGCDPRPGGHGLGDIWVSKRETRDADWGLPVNLGPNINSFEYDGTAHLSADGLSLFFSASPLGYTANGDIFVSTRATVTDSWGYPSRFEALNSARHDTGLTFAIGDSTLYFVRSDPYNPNATYEPALATFDLWQVEVTPVVDFNGDGIVDCVDICVMTDFWGTNESLCDIAPPPFGDGIVDVQDLILLVEHLTSAADDPNAVVDLNLVTP